MSTNLAKDLNLNLHEVPNDAYSLKAANGQPITFYYETGFVMALSHELKFHIMCLVSNDLTYGDIIISWSTMSKLGMFLLSNNIHQKGSQPCVQS